MPKAATMHTSSLGFLKRQHSNGPPYTGGGPRAKGGTICIQIFNTTLRITPNGCSSARGQRPTA
ncbi:uncharacterized protein MYCFIDRAFT_171270 [Pseudocercospora fijiensis CIRAD86]|uniref:Uncharacterized protein n=1 Tax=Pseudocercospora fijiensis (strain CIRAD86) TaxID=383855 RepID=M3A2D0_PSEFD|nr:uncharacterized protein MYCFIDRAFT_171270 [Pseudocercospora fijiensis CIRAD86]EME85334.1 hypothetical protein MYCFIDRAFT_171270 [Pseudocercospora fijiensis CIRAD86]